MLGLQCDRFGRNREPIAFSVDATLRWCKHLGEVTEIQEAHLSNRLKEEYASWIAKWLDAVQDGTATMSQRTRSSIDSHGGVELAANEARKRGVHLVELTDDKGQKLIAASNHEFNTLC